MRAVFSVLLLFVFASTNAALVSRLDGQAYYDDVLDITWAADANINGVDTWENQQAWVAELMIGGIGGWRLPNMDINEDEIIITCNSVNELECRDNEYGYLIEYYGITFATPGPFSNVQNYVYWSQTEHFLFSDQAWDAGFWNSGGQGYGPKSTNFHAWAVYDGDVAAVPIPATAWLFVSALAGLGWLKRKLTV